MLLLKIPPPPADPLLQRGGRHFCFLFRRSVCSFVSSLLFVSVPLSCFPHFSFASVFAEFCPGYVHYHATAAGSLGDHHSPDSWGCASRTREYCCRLTYHWREPGTCDDGASWSVHLKFPVTNYFSYQFQYWVVPRYSRLCFLDFRVHILRKSVSAQI